MQTKCPEAYNGTPSPLLGAAPEVKIAQRARYSDSPAMAPSQQEAGAQGKTAAPTESFRTASAGGNVFLFLPNIVGYIRLLLLVISVGFAQGGCQGLFFVTYAMSQLLDAVDGELARRFNQVSQFGACFDQLIDRLSSCVLYVLNAVAYPRATPAMIAVLLTDVGGHWLMYVSSVMAGRRSHKQLDATANPVLRAYYTNRPLMVVSVVGYEAFFLLPLALRQQAVAPAASLTSPPMTTAGVILLCLTVPPMLFKVLTNVLQAIHGAKRLASLPVVEKAG